MAMLIIWTHSSLHRSCKSFESVRWRPRAVVFVISKCDTKFALAVHLHRHSTATKMGKEHKMKATYLNRQAQVIETTTDEVSKLLRRKDKKHSLHGMLSHNPFQGKLFSSGKEKLQQVAIIMWFFFLQFWHRGCLLHIQRDFPLTHCSRKEQMELKISVTIFI